LISTPPRLRQFITTDARVVVAEGDGTIGFVVRYLADTAHSVGILYLGTFNNSARASIAG
jgi:diacylglycerol kinase family enzyme